MTSLTDLLGSDLAWVTTEASCRDLKTDQFFPEKARRNVAQMMCADCPLFDPCRDYALARPEVRGIWGGTTDEDRDEIRKGRVLETLAQYEARTGRKTSRGKEVDPCGTTGAYRRHIRAKEPPCRPCLDAEGESRNRYNARRRIA